MTLHKGIRRSEVVVVRDGNATRQTDDVVIEEPLEIRVAGESLATTMRTPGEDRFLAVGFLFAEGVLRNRDDVGSVRHCGRMDDPRYGNTIDVAAGPGVSLDVEILMRTKRVGLTQSACGICGRDNIDDLLARMPKLTSNAQIEARLLLRVPELLADKQPNFARTGGLHAACAIAGDGQVLAHAEDIGRHNAVDKVVGKLLLAGALPRDDSRDNAVSILAVSGRASFEIVQKAAMAGFGAVASVSAPSSLAIDTARAAGVTLAAFVREGRFTLYTYEERVV
ncbi:MAG TPA: formate dehydrogenase accessory sulfurtransferase FdhD [Polyangium sp.]|nr:formate dehydrogenase accessory sulfurtransferase FdhD [Polyangium sp.]